MKICREEVEQLIVGMLVYEGAPTVLQASELLDDSDFSQGDCRLLFEVCLSLVAEQKPVNLIEVQRYLNENTENLNGHLKKLSPNSDAKEAAKSIFEKAIDFSGMYREKQYSSNLISDCRYLREESKREKAKEALILVSRKMQEGNNVDEALEDATRELLALSARSQRLKSYVALEDATEAAIKETEDELAGKVVRLSTGFSDLDGIIYGLEKGRLYAIAAEEKVGKSLFSNQVALHNAKLNHSTAIVSLEMRGSEISKRLAGVTNGQEPLKRLNTLRRFKDETRDLPLFIRDGSAGQAKVLTLARKLYMEKDIELLIVDYLQLVELTGKDRVNEINEFVSKLKGLAMDLEIPIVLIAAVLNKQLSTRSERKPTPSDIRDTGRLANDADCIMFLWKPDEADEHYIELFVSRSRYSKLGRVGLHLNEETLKLSQVSPREAEEVPLKQYNSRRF